MDAPFSLGDMRGRNADVHESGITNIDRWIPHLAAALRRLQLTPPRLRDIAGAAKKRRKSAARRTAFSYTIPFGYNERT